MMGIMQPLGVDPELGERAARTLVHILDAVGTFVFALSGAAAGIRAHVDLFGVLVLSFAAATAGGIVRDLLIGAVPPASIKEWHYLAISVAAGLVMFYWHPSVERMRTPVLTFDAAGLGLFAVAGTQKALAFGIEPVQAALLGMLTGIGGGIVRDLLINEIPTVLRAELYATAALAGAAIVVAGGILGFPPAWTTVTGAVLCFALRMAAIRRGWRLPTARTL